MILLQLVMINVICFDMVKVRKRCKSRPVVRILMKYVEMHPLLQFPTQVI